MRRTTRLALALLLVPACTGDESGLESGLPADKTLGSLSPGESQQFCTASFEYEQALFGEQALYEFSCLSNAIFTTMDEDAATCQTAFDVCMVDSKAIPSAADCVTFGAPADCKATVADHETCVEAILTAEHTAAQGASCTNKTPILEYVDRALSNNPSFDPACTRIATTCPFE